MHIYPVKKKFNKKISKKKSVTKKQEPFMSDEFITVALQKIALNLKAQEMYDSKKSA